MEIRNKRKRCHQYNLKYPHSTIYIVVSTTSLKYVSKLITHCFWFEYFKIQLGITLFLIFAVKELDYTYFTEVSEFISKNW
jgi:hypothetical protein